MADRKNQPRCEGECRHPISFHGGGKTACRALGCKCEQWVGEIPEPVSTI